MRAQIAWGFKRWSGAGSPVCARSTGRLEGLPGCATSPLDDLPSVRETPGGEEVAGAREDGGAAAVQPLRRRRCRRDLRMAGGAVRGTGVGIAQGPGGGKEGREAYYRSHYTV